MCCDVDGLVSNDLSRLVSAFRSLCFRPIVSVSVLVIRSVPIPSGLPRSLFVGCFTSHSCVFELCFCVWCFVRLCPVESGSCGIRILVTYLRIKDGYRNNDIKAEVRNAK